MTLLSSKTIKTNYFGICKQVGYLYVNSTDEVLQPGTYPIQEGRTLGSITAGYRVDEDERFGGSKLLYAVSADLKNGIVTPIHRWRMSSGEMQLDKAGNISLTFTTYNGTTVTATAQYDFSIAADLPHTTTYIPPVQKLRRNGQIVILKAGTAYDLLGNKLQ
jgi:hypothetical protein